MSAEIDLAFFTKPREMLGQSGAVLRLFGGAGRPAAPGEAKGQVDTLDGESQSGELSFEGDQQWSIAIGSGTVGEKKGSHPTSLSRGGLTFSVKARPWYYRKQSHPTYRKHYDQSRRSHQEIRPRYRG